MSGGGVFSHSVEPCHWPSTTENIGFYTTHESTEYWVGESSLAWGAGIGIGFVAVDSPKNLGKSCPTTPADPKPLSSCAANPINVTTGNNFQVETDLVDNSGTGLTLRRYYNSLAIDATAFGMNWRSTYDRSVLRTSGSTQAQVWREDGRVDTFRLVSGSWVADADLNINLVEVSSGGVQTGWQVTRSNMSTENYDIDGKLTSLVTRNGLTTTLTYNSSDQLSTVTGLFGHALTFTYTGGGNVYQMTTPGNDVYTYAYDSNNNLISVTYPDTEIREYTYTDATYPHALTDVIDELGTTYATFIYGPGTAGQPKATTSQHAQTYNGGPQEKFTIVYNSATQSTVTDPAGNGWAYQIQTQHGTKTPTSITSQVDSVTVTDVLDASNNITSRTDEEGRTTTYIYNASNQLISMTEASGTSAARTTTYEYLSTDEDLITKVISESVAGWANDKQTITTYDANRNVTQITEQGFDPVGTPVSRTMTMQYNASGQVTQIDGPQAGTGDTTTIEYYVCATGDECGRLKKITTALGHITTNDTYDADGRLTQMTDPNNVVTTNVYDHRGRVTSVTETPPSGPARVTTYTYDAAGQFATVTAPNGTILTYAYDAAHMLHSITDNLGSKIEYSYDLAGNRTDEDIYDPTLTLTKTFDTTYDLRSQVDTINSAGSLTDFVFDAIGNLTDQTDPIFSATYHTYDAFNRLTDTLDALSGTTQYNYDVNDYLVSVDAPNGATTTYSYNDLGYLLSVISPDTGTTSYTYDGAGNRLTQLNANGITTTYTYDALNRLTTISYPTSSLNVTLTYDAGTNQKGRLTTMVDSSGTTTFIYDVFGNLTQESKLIGGNTHLTAYSYDASNLITQITYPSGRSVDYTRNVLGHVTQVDTTYDAATQTVASSATYEPFGPLNGLTFGNSLVMNRTFDQQYRLTAQTTGLIQNLAFTLDAASNIDGITDAVTPSLTQTFSQDALHRVDAETGNYSTKSYTFDAVGNRLTRTHGATTQTLTYNANSNQLATHDGWVVSLDSAGNTTVDLTQNLSFTYADHNRRSSASVGGIVQANYAYNGQGQRVKKVETTGSLRTFVFHYGINGELIGETVYDNFGAKIEERDYVWLDTLPLAQSERIFSDLTITSHSFVHIHANQLNTPRVASNSLGTIVWRWDSDGYGIGAADQDPDLDLSLIDVRLRFPGQYYDKETDLHYNYFRDYDPTTGRYVQSDPIGLDGGLNTYAYVSANPINKFDFYGLAEICNVGLPFSLGIPHTFLCANGQCGGKHGGGTGPALYSPTSRILDDLPDKPAASCSDVPEKGCDPVSFDKCITRKLRARKLNEPYFFAGANCGSWVVETILECRKTCQKNGF